ncbi:4Fe-4S dicluster domain-containing protein [Magnetofaba australis]|nr:4Fe-4S dicluster domain-containing protein [Magnetofaba australis]
MSGWILPQAELGPFLQTVREQMQVFAPTAVEAEGLCALRPLNGAIGPPDTEARRTMLPPKKLLLPNNETLFTFDAEGYHPAPVDDAPTVLFGLHPCDLRAISLLDRFFGARIADQRYVQRRAATRLIGADCLPDDACFCHSVVASEPRDAVYDLFLWSLEDRFWVTVNGESGAALIDLDRKRFRHPRPADRLALQRRQQLRARMLENGRARRQARGDAQWSWREWSAACFTCGACAMVCPTCVCTTQEEHPSLDGASGERVRRWSACLYQNYDRAAGEHHFRNERMERARNRFEHKMLGCGVGEEGVKCVGCGRCVVNCPAQLPLGEALERAAGNLQRAQAIKAAAANPGGEES